MGAVLGIHDQAAQFRARRRLASALTSTVGAIFVGFAIKLATATLS